MLPRIVNIPRNLHKHARNLVIARATAASRSIWFGATTVIRLARSNDKYTTNRTGNSSIIQGNRVTYRIVARISLSLSLSQPTVLPLGYTDRTGFSRAASQLRTGVVSTQRPKKIAGREKKVAARRRGHSSRPFQGPPHFFSSSKKLL